MAGLKRRNPEARFAIAWFDAHGDFNVPDTTPSGNVWGMPFAMLCGRGDPEPGHRMRRPDRREEDAALLGAQVLDEQESRMLAASPIAHFGSGMLAGPAGSRRSKRGRRVVGARCDGMYIAFDLDAIDASESISVAMPEPDGLSVETAVAAVRVLAATNQDRRVRTDGNDAARPDLDIDRHTDIVARLTEAALGERPGMTSAHEPHDRLHPRRVGHAGVLGADAAVVRGEGLSLHRAGVARQGPLGRGDPHRSVAAQGRRASARSSTTTTDHPRPRRAADHRSGTRTAACSRRCCSTEASAPRAWRSTPRRRVASGPYRADGLPRAVRRADPIVLGTPDRPLEFDSFRYAFVHTLPERGARGVQPLRHPRERPRLLPGRASRC